MTAAQLRAATINCSALAVVTVQVGSEIRGVVQAHHGPDNTLRLILSDPPATEPAPESPGIIIAPTEGNEGRGTE